ncbi:MAG: HAD-IIIC family phosphatase [Gammaproteobacteria bacterium]|nr:HAD-IIIC family phosphatase [Gammaproteobacteria bacterium]
MSNAKRVRFIRNFTIEPIEPWLKRELAVDNIAVHCSFGGFATAAEEIAALDTTPPEDLTVLALGLEMSSPDFGHSGWDAEAACNRLLLLAREGVARSRGQLLLNTALGPLYNVNGGASMPGQRSAEASVDALNAALRELQASDPARIALADWALYARQLGEADTYDQRFWCTSGAPFGRRFLARYARDIAASLRLMAGKVRKCLVLDCDNTLWGGVIGEDGLKGIQLSEDTLPGAYYRAFHRAVLDLHARGIAIALASKNNEADVMQVLEQHPHTLIKREHLSTWRINWEEKPVSLSAVAAELNLGLDALVFVDDNPLECELVAQTLPQVRVLRVPAAKEELVGLLQRYNPFEALVVTTADRSRNTSYLENRQRTEFSETMGDLSAYKREIGAKLLVRPVDKADLARVVQLLQRTNQFNLTSRRYSAEQVRTMLADSATLLLCAELRDRFGDLGLIGVAIAHRTGPGATVDSLLMSCRALGRDAELAFAGAIYARISAAWQPQWIEAEYVASAKNAMVANFWVRAGLERVKTNGVDVSRFRATPVPKLNTVAPDFVTLEMKP